MKADIKQECDWWISRLGHFRHCTDNFTLPLAGLSDDELVNLPGVYSEWLSFVPFMLKVLHEKSHAEIRRAVAYLYCLHDLQAGAWARTMEKWEQQLAADKCRLKELQEKYGSR